MSKSSNLNEKKRTALKRSKSKTTDYHSPSSSTTWVGWLDWSVLNEPSSLCNQENATWNYDALQKSFDSQASFQIQTWLTDR